MACVSIDPLVGRVIVIDSGSTVTVCALFQPPAMSVSAVKVSVVGLTFTASLSGLLTVMTTFPRGFGVQNYRIGGGSAVLIHAEHLFADSLHRHHRRQ